MNQNVLQLLKSRRSIYALGKNVQQNQAELVDAIEAVIEETPTAFNSQTTRAVFLFGDKHDQLWDIVVARLKSEVPTEAAYEKTKQKIAAFKAAYGTILYFTDTASCISLSTTSRCMLIILPLGRSRGKVPRSSTPG